MFAFSTCWNSHRHSGGRELVNEVRALGFEYVELGHGTQLTLLEGVREAVAANEIKVSSVHNFCPLPPGILGPAPNCYRPSSRDETERHLAAQHTLRTIDCAASLGAGTVVLHLGSVAMRDYTTRLLSLCANGNGFGPRFQQLRDKALAARGKKSRKHFDQVCRTLETILPRARETGVKLGMETRFGIEEIPDEVEMDQILSRFGAGTICYWHDVGHTLVKESLGLMKTEVILERFRGRMAGMHLQDFAPPADDHRPPGLGTFDFMRLAPFVTDDMILAWEIHPQWNAKQITESVQQVHGLLQKPVTA